MQSRRDTTHQNVKIVCSTTAGHDHGSSKVKLKNIVDYKWEIKKYPGHLIAVHMDGKHIAYVIKVNNKQSGVEEGMVRVVNTQSGQRALIKCLTGEVLDVQFAHIERVHILACIDLNSLYVHKIDMLSDNLICNLLLKIDDPMENYSTKYNKISWCPFYQEEYTSSDDEGEDSSQLIVWSRGKIFQCFNVNIIINSHGIGKHNPKDLTDGYLQSIDNTIIITWVSLSPDGTTLSVGSEDGFIRFYQVYFHEKEPRCLHQWNPHNGQPISSFFFLDNYLKKSSSDTFWKHALTGSKNNTEFKIWDCGSWECLQQIQLVPAHSADVDPSKQQQDGSLANNLCLTAEIDITSTYLVLSNVESRTIYILQIVNNGSNQDNNKKQKFNNDKTTKTKRKRLTFIRSVSEFPLSSPILSFSIVNASIRKLNKCALNENYFLDDIDYDYDDENSAISCVVVRMFVVQPKSVQECQILYQPVNSSNVVSENDSGSGGDNNNSVYLELSEEDHDEEEIPNEKIKSEEISDDDLMLNMTANSYNDVVKTGIAGVKKVPEISSFTSPSNILLKSLVPSTDKSVSASQVDVNDKTKTLNQKLRVVDDSILLIKGRKSASPLIPGLPNLESPQESNDIPTEVDDIQSTSVKNQPNISSISINHAQKSHFSQVNLMTPNAFSAPSSSATSIQATYSGAGKKSPAESVNSDVLSTILMLASVTGSQNSKKNAENINLLNLMNNKMIEDQEYQKQFSKSSTSVEKVQVPTKTKFLSLVADDDDDDDNDHNDDGNDKNDQNNSSDVTSGGSSPPSREVQEIMSLKDYECKLSNFTFNEQQDIIVDNISQPPEAFLNSSEVINSKTQQLINSGPGGSQNVLNNDYKTTNKNEETDESNKKKITKSTTDNLLNWPNIPDINTVIGMKMAQKEISTTVEQQQQAQKSKIQNSEEIQNMNAKMDELINLMQQQSTKISDLQMELNSLKVHNDNTNSLNNKHHQSNFAEFKRQIERQILPLFEQFVMRYEKEHSFKYDDFLTQFEALNRDLRERLNQSNQLLFNELYEQLAQTVKAEIQRNVIPVLLVKLDTIQSQIQSEVATKLTTTDSALKENISQLCKSKPIIDTFGKSVLFGVQGSLQAAFIESMSSTLIPAYEKSSQNMFRQLHETFSIGIKQVMEQFDNYLSQLQPVQDTTDEILSRCIQFREILETNFTRQTTTMTDTFLDTKKDIKTLEINFIRHFSELIKKEIRKNFEQQASSLEDSVLNAVRSSRANTPAPSSTSHVMSVYDVQDQIKHLLSTGQINAAFHQALLSNNLNLVEYTLEKAEYKTVFNPCTLEQTVLLSLIQQISADMSQHNELKQQYLSDGILNLIPTDPITKEHAPKVMKELMKNCQHFLQANTKNPMCSNIRMIMMAIQGMGYKF